MSDLICLLLINLAVMDTLMDCSFVGKRMGCVWSIRSRCWRPRPVRRLLGRSRPYLRRERRCGGSQLVWCSLFYSAPPHHSVGKFREANFSKWVQTEELRVWTTRSTLSDNFVKFSPNWVLLPFNFCPIHFSHLTYSHSRKYEKNSGIYSFQSSSHQW
jgi:hypothetical protein